MIMTVSEEDVNQTGKSDVDKPKTTGWGCPNPTCGMTRFHYFGEDGRSLCNKWMNAFGAITLEEGGDDHRQNCRECTRKKAALTPQEAV